MCWIVAGCFDNTKVASLNPRYLQEQNKIIELLRTFILDYSIKRAMLSSADRPTAPYIMTGFFGCFHL